MAEELEKQQEAAPKRRLRRIDLISVAAGLSYGLIARLFFGYHALEQLFGVMTFAFIVLVPFALGFVAVYVGEQDAKWSWLHRARAPLLPATLALVAAMALAWEGLICIVLWGPIYLAMACLGGVVAGAVRTFTRGPMMRGYVFCSVMVLPFLASPLEHRIDPELEQRVVNTFIDIQASPKTVWANIIRVPAFQPEEHHRALSHLIGFPRPVEATLSHEGIGGVRHASFEGNVVFVETVNVWEPEKRLAFAIKADTEAIPVNTLDEHVTVGGPYFDVLQGEYQIEPLPTGGIRLHLSSIHRLSTNFNFYSSLWTDFIMRDVQTYILAILKERCERQDGRAAVRAL